MTGPGRNAPCPCGSGRKHKHCCLDRLGHRGDGCPVCASTSVLPVVYQDECLTVRDGTGTVGAAGAERLAGASRVYKTTLLKDLAGRGVVASMVESALAGPDPDEARAALAELAADYEAVGLPVPAELRRLNLDSEGPVR